MSDKRRFMKSLVFGWLKIIGNFKTAKPVLKLPLIAFFVVLDMQKYITLTLAALFLTFSGQTKDKTQATLPSKPLRFIENKGQIVDQHKSHRQDIDYVVTDANVSLFIGNGQLHYQWHRPDNKGVPVKMDVLKEGKVETYRMDVELIGADKDAYVLAEGKTGFYENYYLSQCPDGISAFAYSKLTYKNIYPHIDWVFYFKDGMLEHEFVVRPGGDPTNIRLKYDGATELKITSSGTLDVMTPMGGVAESAPYSFQEDGKAIASSFELNGDVLSFNVGKYEGILTIDPTLDWGTYFGGGAGESSMDIAADSLGSTYIVGYTQSIDGIVTTGGHQQTLSGGLYSGYIAKFDSSGVQQWGTYYGGNDITEVNCVESDGAGHIYVAGFTKATNAIATVGAHQDTLGEVDGADLFLVKFNAQGIRQWGTYVGGEKGEEFPSLSYDGYGHVYLTAHTYSYYGIASNGTYLDTLPVPYGEPSSFLAKFDANGVRLWGTYLDSASTIQGLSSDNNTVYVMGTTHNTQLATPGSYQEAYTARNDAFISRFSVQGQRIWSTYFGGDSTDEFFDAIIDPIGNLYICGVTNSINQIATLGSGQEIAGGKRDVMFVKFNDAGERIWSTYFGGDDHDDVAQGSAMCFDDSGNVFISGATRSGSNIAGVGSHQSVIGGGTDAYLAKFDTSGSKQWATYYGGGGDEGLTSCAFGRKGRVFISGITISNSSIATPGSHKDQFSGFWDCFIAKFQQDYYSPPQSTNNIITLQQLSIYPNPVTDELHIDGVEHTTQYTLTTITGSKVQEGMLQEHKAIVNMKDLIPGIYMLNTETGWKLKVVKN